MIIVTGGAGFIGSNFIALLERSVPDDIVVCDWLDSTEKWRNLAKRELSDFVQPDDLFRFLEHNAGSIQMIFHMGAISATNEPDVNLIIQTNFHLSCALWDFCVHHDIRFVYASSAATYGDGAAGFVDDASPAALARLRPLNAYGWSKHLFDRRVARHVARGESTPPQWAGLKFFNVYGPNEYHKTGMISVARTVWQAVSADKPALLFRSGRADIADGEQMRDFVWVGNCAAVMKWLWESPDVSGLFNVGSGKARSFKDLALAVFAAMGKPPRLEYRDMPAEIAGLYQYFTEADLTRLRAAGYIAPFTELEEGVTRYITDFLATPDPYR